MARFLWNNLSCTVSLICMWDEVSQRRSSDVHHRSFTLLEQFVIPLSWILYSLLHIYLSPNGYHFQELATGLKHQKEVNIALNNFSSVRLWIQRKTAGNSLKEVTQIPKPNNSLPPSLLCIIPFCLTWSKNFVCLWQNNLEFPSPYSEKTWWELLLLQFKLPVLALSPVCMKIKFKTTNTKTFFPLFSKLLMYLKTALKSLPHFSLHFKNPNKNPNTVSSGGQGLQIFDQSSQWPLDPVQKCPIFQKYL